MRRNRCHPHHSSHAARLSWRAAISLAVTCSVTARHTASAEPGGYTLERAAISYGGGVTSNGSYFVVDQFVVGPMTSPSYTIDAGAAVVVGSVNSPTRANDSCSGGAQNGQPCAQNSDCPGGFCQLKNRFISATLPGTATAHGVKINIVSIDANSVTTPSNYNGTDRWAGAPSLNVSDGISPSFDAAKLQCAFTSQNWSTVGQIHLYGDVIVPLSSYDVSLCSSANGPCSPTLRIGTAKFGDIIPPTNTTNFQDISSIVAKFSNTVGAPSKTRAKLREQPAGGVDPTTAVNFLEVQTCVSAFQGKTYKQIFTTPPATCP